MTDSSSLIPNNIGITSDLLYNLKPSSGRGRSYRCSVQPTNASTFLPQSTTIFYIPGGRKNTFLDPQQSYIKYTILNYDTTGGIRCDGSAASFINRLDVFHASNLLESIQQYNVLYNFLMDFQINLAARDGLSNIMGFDGANPANSITRDGALIGTASAAATPTKLTVCLPVLSGVFGMLLDKMLPVGALNDDIRVELTWESLSQGCVYGSANTAFTSWQITNVELELCYVELQDDSMSIVNSASNIYGDLFLHGKSWRHYVSTLPTGTSGTYSTLVPQRFASSCGLVLCPRRGLEISGASVNNAYSTSSRINPNIDQYWWRVGSLLIPQKYVVLKNSSATTGSVGGYGEAFMEIQKFFHSMNHPEYTSSIPFVYYNIADNGTADGSVGQGGIIAPVANTAAGMNTSYTQAFAIAQNLETYSQKSDVIISGMNTLSAQTFFECNIGTATAQSYTLDFYAMYDHILVKDAQGILSVRF